MIADLCFLFRQAQISESPVKSVTVSTWGGRDVNITTKQARQLLEAQVRGSIALPLTAKPRHHGPHALQVLIGLVKHAGTGMVPDMVSAPFMAKVKHF